MYRLTPGSQYWPHGFSDLKQPPGGLYFEGRLPETTASVVAVVGTRLPTRRAEAYTFGLAAELARSGIWVLSGGALGIDTAAHEGALGEGGRTIVVQASGLARPYPRQNEGLFSRIVAEGGAVVSEATPQTAPHRGLFLKRNRLVASWASETIVVQAPLRSGALHTAGLAMSFGREVFVAQGPPWDPRHAGCNALASRGARTLAPLHRRAQRRPNLSKDARQLLLFVESDDGQSADQLAARSELDGATTGQALCELELEALVENRNGLFFAKE